MAWVLLIIAGLLETGWAIGLKYTEGFTKPLPSVLTIIGIVVSMFLLSLAARTLPIGTAYAVWVGIGAAGAAILGMVAAGRTGKRRSYLLSRPAPRGHRGPQSHSQISHLLAQSALSISRSRQPDRAATQLLQFLDAHRLAHVQIESAFVGPSLVFFARAARHRHQNQMDIAPLLPNAAHRFESVQARHAQIDQRHVRRKCRHLLDGFLTVVNGLRFIAESANQQCQCISRITIVIDDENMRSPSNSPYSTLSNVQPRSDVCQIHAQKSLYLWAAMKQSWPLCSQWRELEPHRRVLLPLQN